MAYKSPKFRIRIRLIIRNKLNKIKKFIKIEKVCFYKWKNKIKLSFILFLNQ
jgi:hypothetical protein